MNALYISYDGATEALGQSQIIAYLQQLVRYGIKFNLLTFEKPVALKNKQKIGELYNSLADRNIHWSYLKYHKYPLILATAYDLLKGLVVAAGLVNKGGIKVVHARSYPPALVALILKKLFRLKFIFDMRGFWADERLEGKIWKKKTLLYHLVKILENYLLEQADAVIVLTRPAQEILKSWGYNTDKVYLIPCCTDTDRFKFNSSHRDIERKKLNLEGKFVFVHTGSLEYWYMKEQMLEYFKVAKQVLPDAHFLILANSGKEEILKLILAKGLDSADFTIISALYSDMPRYLAVADVGLILITPVFSKKASSPTKFAEYLSCCVPVIINKGVGDMGEYVRENNIGVVVEEFSDNHYRESLGKLLLGLKDEGLKLRCRQVACDNFSLQVGTEKYSQVYARLNQE